MVAEVLIAVWQKANVTAFLISGVAATDPTLVGEPYIDGSGHFNDFGAQFLAPGFVAVDPA